MNCGPCQAHVGELRVKSAREQQQQSGGLHSETLKPVVVVDGIKGIFL